MPVFRFLFLIQLSLSYSVLGQVQPFYGARAIGIGAGQILLTDAHSAINNPATTAFCQKSSVGLSYRNLFLLPDLNDQSAAFNLRLRKSAWGVSYSGMGSTYFREDRASTHFAMKLAKGFSAGVSFNYHHLYQGRALSSMHLVSGDISLYGRPGEHLILAAQIKNMVPYRVSDGPSPLPTLISLAAGYHLKEKVLIVAQCDKDMERPLSLALGMEYVPLEAFQLRAGMGLNPARASFGIGTRVRWLQLDLASTWHHLLGFSPTFSMSIEFHNKKDGNG